MSIGTLLRYLCGDRAAILTLAGHPRTWLIGLIFVLSAGFAREYDGEDLLHSPWYLVIPLGASVVSSLALFCMFYVPGRLARADLPPFLTAYRAFLGLFWMTAPLAWLYAIPYERLLGPVAAVHANLGTLALVSVWRVALMVRVGIVLFGLSPWAAFFRVLAFADTVALIAIFFLPFRIIEIMGGMRVSEAERAVRSAAAWVAFLGGVSLLVWWLNAFSAVNRSSWALSRTEEAAADGDPSGSASRPAEPVRWPLRILALVSLAIWIPILPRTQREQQVRCRVESAFREGRFHDALAEMSAHQIADFPPQWQPPPHFLKGDPPALVLDIYDEILRADPAPWVRQHYLDRFTDFVERDRYGWHNEKIARLLNRMPEGAALLRKWAAEPDMQYRLDWLDSYLRPELRRANLKED
jgi:hypothetical protein